jgi:hypothetical protein
LLAFACFGCCFLHLRAPSSVTQAVDHLQVVGTTHASSDVRRLVRAVTRGLRCCQEPDAAETGLGGTYFFRSEAGAHVAIVKPCDEEPLAPNNPKVQHLSQHLVCQSVASTGTCQTCMHAMACLLSACSSSLHACLVSMHQLILRSTTTPQGFVGRELGQPGLKPTVRVGEAALREVAAFLLDHDNFAKVRAAVLPCSCMDPLGLKPTS